MKRCQFNFNNEVDTFEIHVEDDGRVIVPGENGPLAEYDSVQQLAEIYAQARDVKPENLKNWTLLEHGNVYSFVLRAGTAGVDVCDVEVQLEEVFTSLSGKYHALSIARAKEQIMRDGTVDLTDALVHCDETEIARDIYDAMEAFINGDMVTGHAVAAMVEDVDNRTPLEKYIDRMEETPGAIGFFATLVGLSADTAKEDVVAALAGNIAFSNVESLKAVFDNAVSAAINEGIGVNCVNDALTVMTQTAFGIKDDAIKNRLAVTTRMAGRSKVNVSVDIVGETHIRHTAELISVEELEGADLFVRDNIPYIVRFSNTIDAELEAERDGAAATEEEAVDQSVVGVDDEDSYEDEDDYDEEY